MVRLGIQQRAVLMRVNGPRGKRTNRQVFVSLLTQRGPTVKDVQETVTKTMERLIDGGYLIGYGVRTPKKWYINEVSLTPVGRRIVKKLRGEQQKLPHL